MWIFHEIKMPKTKDYLKDIPNEAGVYRLFHENGRLLYIGSSQNLRKRINQHLSGSSQERYWKKQTLQNKTRYLDYRITDEAKTALKLENVLINFFKPKVNRVRYPVGTYAFIVIKKIPFHHIRIFRGDEDPNKLISKDFFYRIHLSSRILRNYFEKVRKVLPFCLQHPSQCWDDELGKCEGECKNSPNINKETKNITKILNYLSGNNIVLEEELKELMDFHSSNLEFEKSKTVLEALSSLLEIKKEYVGKSVSRDIDNIEIKENSLHISCLKEGSEISSWNHIFPFSKIDELRYFYIIDAIREFYVNQSFVPQQITINYKLRKRSKMKIEKWLKELFFQKVLIIEV